MHINSGTNDTNKMTPLERMILTREYSPAQLARDVQSKLGGLFDPRRLLNYRKGKRKLPADVAVVLADLLECEVKNIVQMPPQTVN